MTQSGLKAFTILLAMTLMAAATAQDQAPTENQKQEQPQTQQESADEATETIGDKPVSGTGNSRFEPSEEVSEDLSISFPADI